MGSDWTGSSLKAEIAAAIAQADQAAEDCDAYFAKRARQQQAEPEIIYKTYEPRPEPAPMAPPAGVSREFVVEVACALGGEVGKKTGALERRIITLETEIKKLNDQLAEAFSELTLMRVVKSSSNVARMPSGKVIANVF